MNKRFLSIAASTAIMASAIVFTGCGSSSSTTTTTSSTSSTSGTSTGVFFKGLWAGISYNSTAASGTTNSTGHYSYSANQNTDFDLGLFKVRANTTALATSGVVYAAQASDVATGATVTSTQIGNLLGVLSAFGINETTANSTKLAAILTKLSTLKAQDAVTYNASSATMSVDTVTTAIAASTGYANTTVALPAATAYAAYAAAAATNMQTVGASVANLNTSFLQNKAIFLSDGTILAMNGSMLGSNWLTNDTANTFTTKAISLVGGGDAATGGGKTSNSSNSTVANVSNGWSASGAFINLTPGGVNNTIAFSGPFAKGTTVTVVNGTGFMRTLTVAGIGYNLVPALKAANMNGSTDVGTANRSISFNGNTYTLEGANYTGGVTTTGLGRVFINGTNSGIWNLTNSTFGYTLNITNASATQGTVGVNQSVAFDDDITANSGVIATIWSAVSNTVSTVIAAFLKVIATASKLI